MSATRFSPRRLARAAGRRIPRGPFRVLLPYALLRRPVGFWLSAVATDPDRRRALRRLLDVHEETRKLVGRTSIAYDGGVHVKHRLTRYHDFFVERIRAGEHVLDIGCGKGELARDIAERAGAVVVGVDNNPAHLEFAKERSSHARVRYVDRDVREGLPAGHFDVVVLSNVLEHFEHRVDLLRRAVASARPDRVLIRVPAYARDWVVPLREEVGLPYFSDPTHYVEYWPDELRAELGDAGLEEVELVAVWGELWVTARPVGP